MGLSESDTRAKLIDPAIHACGWTEDLIRREETAGSGKTFIAVHLLKAVNPNVRRDQDTRTPEELLDLIEAKGRKVAEAVAVLRQKSNAG